MRMIVCISLLGWSLLVWGSLSCSNTTTGILITQCREKVEQLEVYVWKPSYGNPFRGACTDANFSAVDNGNAIKPVYSVSPKSGENFEIPSLGTGEQLMFRYRGQGGLSECEPCQEGAAARGDKPCTLQGPSWCKPAELSPEPGLEPGPEPGPEPGLEPGPEPSPEPGLEPGPEAGPEPGPEPTPEPTTETTLCKEDANCSNGWPCLSGVCRPCATSSECKQGGSDRVCANGKCIPGACLTLDDCKTKDCKDGQCRDAWKVCVNNRCVECSGDEQQCGTGKVCYSEQEGAPRVCVEGDCLYYDSCDEGLVCTKNRCSPCVNDKECSHLPAHSCQKGKCAPKPCTSFADCEVGNKACVNGTCSACTGDKDCGPLRRCFGSGLCVAISCTTHANCASYGLGCVSGFCAFCQNSTQCNTGMNCVDKRCQPGFCSTGGSTSCFGQQLCLKEVCRSCVSDRECAAGTCLDCLQRPGCGKICATTCPDYCR